MTKYSKAWWIRVGIVLAILIAAIVGQAVFGAEPPKAEPKATIKVEEARIATLEKAVNDQKGKVVLVDFWATWCPPCVKKFPSVVALHKSYKDKGLVVVTMSLDKGRRGYKIDKVLDFLSDNGATCTNFIVAEAGTDGPDIVKKFGIGDSIPYLTMFDKKGKRIWDSNSKPLSEKDLAVLVEIELARE